jgi:uncharacterized membrane protein
MATLPEPFETRRWVAPVLALGALMLVPWTLVLAYRLPAQHTSHHWDIAWVGFDLALAASLAVTGWTIARRSAWAPSAAAVAATLLFCDAWFDVVLSSGHDGQVEAILEAVLVEIPLAVFLVWLARDCEQTVASVMSAFRRERQRPLRRRQARGAGESPASAVGPRARARRSPRGAGPGDAHT